MLVNRYKDSAIAAHHIYDYVKLMPKIKDNFSTFHKTQHSILPFSADLLVQTEKNKTT